MTKEVFRFFLQNNTILSAHEHVLFQFFFYTTDEVLEEKRAKTNMLEKSKHKILKQNV